MEAFGTAAGFVLTLLILSYLLGDNPLYRLAIYLLIGLAAAFTTLITFEGVLIPLVTAAADGEITTEDLVGLVSLVAGLVLLVLLLFRRLPGAGIALAFLIAVGAALAVVGSITGTLLPLTLATGTLTADNLFNGLVILVGVITSLVYFQYVARRTPDGQIQRGRLVQGMSAVGQGFIVVTLGALYGAAILTSLTILSERVSFLVRGG
ncbi:MAG: hypothetical protein MUE40_19270 [Anaerolineae bacterium]|nr:hypothetical protein [Anaerolineae bacterium]